LVEAADYQNLMWSSGGVLIRDEPFILKSGRQSYVYVNHRDLICLPHGLRLFAALIIANVRDAFGAEHALATVDSSVSPFLVAACAAQVDVPFYNYRAVSREKGISQHVFRYDRNAASSFHPGLPAVLVDDVVTTMSTLTNAAQTLREQDIEVLGASCLLDRRVASDLADDLVISSISSLTALLEHGLADSPVSDEHRRLIDIELMALRN
jgi:orotate phosphoribosyltransferase